MTHEDYCTYEQSIKLKELGFDWIYGEGFQEKTYYNSLKTLCQFDEEIVTTELPAPTLAQAQKWLREKGIIVLAGYEPYKYWLIENEGPKWKYYINSKDSIHHSMAEFNSYEQALSAGVDKAFELLKEEMTSYE